MRKSILLFVFFATSCSMVVAQNMRFLEGEFRFGLHASPTFSYLRSSDKYLEAAGTNLGLKLGFTAEKYFATNYALTAGIGFGFNQGGTIQSNYTRGVYFSRSVLSTPALDTIKSPVKLHYRVNFVEIPFSIRFRGGTNEDARFRYFAEAPIITLGFVNKALADIRNTTTNQNSEDEGVRRDVNAISLAWGAGAGVEYELASNTTFVGGIYYQHQFTDLTNNSGRVYNDQRQSWLKEDSKTAFRAISLRLGVYF